MAGLLRAMIPKKVALHYQVQDGLRPIEADAAQIRQVIMNLITNAAESMTERAGRVVISVEEVQLSARDLEEYPNHAAAPGTGFLNLEVEDDGCAHGRQRRAVACFDPFFTTRIQRARAGCMAAGARYRAQSRWRDPH